ncbi:serine hydrolase domain-containing protein [Puia dinghuensis]|uniref:serine hydrolase domain-containing protein n=1 Tax=Puia dinghuensis TaxID=1792502 RepID=UPI00166D232A|nr:serine hydrolase [Puia dinghuensis]
MLCRNLLPVLLFLITSPAFSQSKNAWPTSSPEEQRINSATLADAIKRAKQHGDNIHSLLIIKNNHIVLDAGFYPFKNSYVHDLASCTKSIMSLLIGIAIDKGFIKSENEHILDFFPEYKITNDTLKAVTIRDLLNMSSGFHCSWNDGEKELSEMRASKDWVKYMLSLPFSNYPNAQFSYCSGNYYLLAEILQRTTKVNCLNFAKKYLFKPLGFGKSYWLSNYKGVNQGWGDLHISIYDFAKIGCLVLNDGVWNGNRIISKKWLEKIQPLHKIQKTESYGYGWWLDSENPDEIQAVGRGGQRLFIFKGRNMVIATNGGGGYESGDIDNIGLEAIQAYRNGENSDSLLQKEIRDVALPDTSTLTAESFPDDELNKYFLLTDNDMGLKGMRFEKRKSGYYILLDYVDGFKDEHPIGMNNQYKISKEHDFGLPMAVKGKWANDTLKIDFNRLCRIEDYRFSIVFKKGNSMELTLIEDSRRIDQIFSGKSL